jgi:hypothetical protein
MCGRASVSIGDAAGIRADLSTGDVWSCLGVERRCRGDRGVDLER